jgi:hypothetical protein
MKTGRNESYNPCTFKMRQTRRAASFVILAIFALLVISALGNSCARYASRQSAIVMGSSGDMKAMSPDEAGYDRTASMPAGDNVNKLMSEQYNAPGAAVPPSPPGQDGSSVFSQSAFAQEGSVPGVKPMIVYNGSLSLKVAKLKAASDAVIAMLPKYNGYLSNMSEETSGSLQMVTITARVDAGKVMDFIAEAKKLGEVLNANLTGDEVTEEFVDLQAQLDALNISAARLKDMLAKSGKVSDLQEVERELFNRQTQINQVEGRMRYLKDRSRLATVEITLNTEAPPSPSNIQFSWGFGEVFQQAWANLKYTVRSFIAGVISFLVGAIFWLPALAILAWIFWVALRRIRRSINAKLRS